MATLKIYTVMNKEEVDTETSYELANNLTNSNEQLIADIRYLLMNPLVTKFTVEK